MNKTGNNNESMILTELQQLRKGSGLTAWKLQTVTEVRKAVARQLGVQPTGLAMGQLHAYLLYEINELGDGNRAKALRNAYAIGQEHRPGSLTTRRADFSLQIDRHADTIKAYENQALKQLAHRLATNSVLPAPLTMQSSDAMPVRHSRLEKTLQKSVIEGLGGLYELGSHAPEALRIFGRNDHPYLDANVECVLLPSARGEDWYTLRLRYIFQSTKAIFRIGVTSSVQDCGILMASGLFEEVTKLNEDADFDREVATLISNCRFVIHDLELGEQQALWFTELDPPMRRELLKDVWQLDTDTCRVIEVHIPEGHRAKPALFELQERCELRVDEHYAFWEAPGLMYLNTLTVDVSQFPAHEKWRFFIKPFLGTTFPDSLEANGDRFTLPASSWITAGHGVAIIWQETVERI